MWRGDITRGFNHHHSSKLGYSCFSPFGGGRWGSQRRSVGLGGNFLFFFPFLRIGAAERSDEQQKTAIVEYLCIRHYRRRRRRGGGSRLLLFGKTATPGPERQPTLPCCVGPGRPAERTNEHGLVLFVKVFRQTYPEPFPTRCIVYVYGRADRVDLFYNHSSLSLSLSLHLLCIFSASLRAQS